MQINVTVDCTPEEARELLGLPDVKRIQDKWLEIVSENISENAENFAPEKILNSWISGASPNVDIFAGLINSFVQSGKK